jgi:hypothetical protein
MLHALVALALQAAIGLTTGMWWVGAVLAVGLFAGREHAQAEYRWIERYGLGLRANMPWHGGFQPRVWHVKAMFDLIAPIAATTTLALLIA